MITAEEARKLSQPSVENEVRRICEAIEEYAKDGQTAIAVFTGFWQYSDSEDRLQAVDTLEELGYRVSFEKYDSERVQGDVTLISWE